MTALELSVRSEFAALGSADRRATFVARIVPPPPPSHRPPVRVVLALDTSGSMEGDKLDRAVMSATALVKALGSADTFACISFASDVATVLPPEPMTHAGKTLALQCLGALRASSATDLAGGMLKALEIAGADTRPGRVLLLTDGCPTSGVVETDAIVALARGASPRGTLSTFGYGRDVNPALLRSLADVGRGNYTFIAANEPPIEAIGAELGGLLSTVAAGVTLEVQAAKGVSIAVLHRLDGRVERDVGTRGAMELPPLVAEEPLAVVFELAWEGEINAESLALVTLRARSTETGELVMREAGVRPARAAQRGAIDPNVERDILLARAAHALRSASDANDKRAPDVASELRQAYGELLAAARMAGLEGEPLVAASLAMMRDMEGRLLQTSVEAVRSARQDLVAASHTLSRGRSSMIAPGYAGQDAWRTPSQIKGRQLVDDAAKTPGPVVVETRSDDEDDGGPKSQR